MRPKDKPPSDPPSRVVLFYNNKIFLVGKYIYNGQNKFYAWSHVEIFLSISIIMVQFYHKLSLGRTFSVLVF